MSDFPNKPSKDHTFFLRPGGEYRYDGEKWVSTCLLRDTPEGRERLASALGCTCGPGPKNPDGYHRPTWKHCPAAAPFDAIIAALRADASASDRGER